MCIVHACGYSWVTARIWRSEDNLCALVLNFPPCLRQCIGQVRQPMGFWSVLSLSIQLPSSCKSMLGFQTFLLLCLAFMWVLEIQVQVSRLMQQTLLPTKSSPHSLLKYTLQLSASPERSQDPCKVTKLIRIKARLGT